MTDTILQLLSGKSIRDLFLCEEVDLDEAGIKFNGRAFPKNGICCVLAGGPGSGKGYISSRKILANFYKLDVDDLKSLYIKVAQNKGYVKDVYNYDITDPEDVSKLHAKIKDLGWDKKKVQWFFNYCVRNDSMPNVLFDITGSKISKLKNIGEQAKGCGYHVALVWVVTPRQVAIINNLSRARRVSQEVFHSTHDEVIESVFSFLDGMAVNYDQCFVCFNPGKNVADLSPEMQEIAKKYDFVELKKVGSSFELPEDVKNDILSFLGSTDASQYKDFKDIDVRSGAKGALK